MQVTYIHYIPTLDTYYSRFVSEGIAEASQIFLQEAYVYLAMWNIADLTGRNPIAV
jgi:hypothetical protein